MHSLARMSANVLMGHSFALHNCASVSMPDDQTTLMELLALLRASANGATIQCRLHSIRNGALL